MLVPKELLDQGRQGSAQIVVGLHSGLVPVPAPRAQGLAKIEMRKGKPGWSVRGSGLVSWIITGSCLGGVRGQAQVLVRARIRIKSGVLYVVDHRCTAAPTPRPALPVPGPLPPASLIQASSPDSPAGYGCRRRRWGSHAWCAVGPGWAGQMPRPEQMEHSWSWEGRLSGRQWGPRSGSAPTSTLRIMWPRTIAASLSRWSLWYSQTWRSGGKACRAESVGHSIVKGLWNESRSRGSRPAIW